jgi:hypothetical protein
VTAELEKLREMQARIDALKTLLAETKSTQRYLQALSAVSAREKAGGALPSAPAVTSGGGYDDTEEGDEEEDGIDGEGYDEEEYEEGGDEEEEGGDEEEEYDVGDEGDYEGGEEDYEGASEGMDGVGEEGYVEEQARRYARMDQAGGLDRSASSLSTGSDAAYAPHLMR